MSNIQSTFRDKTLNLTNKKMGELFNHFKDVHEIQNDTDIQENQNMQQSNTKTIFDDDEHVDQQFSAVFNNNNNNSKCPGYDGLIVQILLSFIDIILPY